MLGVTWRAVRNWEAGDRRVPAAALYCLRHRCQAHGKPTPAAILHARRTARLPQQTCSALVGVVAKHWEHWEAGRHAMPSFTWAAFLHATGLPPDFNESYDPLRSTAQAFRR